MKRTSGVTQSEPPNAFQAASFLYLSGGFMPSRKKLHGALMACEATRDLFGQPDFDYYYFGPRASAVESSFEQAVGLGFATQHLYAKYAYDNDKRRTEPPHMAFVLTDQGASYARAYLRKLEAQKPEFRAGALASQLLAWTWVPQSLAISYGIRVAEKSDLPVRLKSERRSASIGVSPSPHEWKEFRELIRQCRATDNLRLREDVQDQLKLEYTLNPQQCRKKYSYLDGEIRQEADLALQDVDAAKKPWQEFDELTYQSLATRIGDEPGHLHHLEMLLSERPEAGGWRDSARGVLESIQRNALASQEALHRNLSNVEVIAALTKLHGPVLAELQSKEGRTWLSTEWAGKNSSQAHGWEKRLGARGLQAYLDDPPDLLSYLGAVCTGVQPEALETTLV